MGKTSIEWAHWTFNPWIGCQKVSPACTHCYAEVRDKRFDRGIHWGPGSSRRRTSPSNWRKPFTWNRRAAEAGIRQRVFCASLADVFEDHPDLIEWRRELMEQVVSQTPQLDWLLLTKRPERVLQGVPRSWRDGFPPNVWVGTTVEDQQRAVERIPCLLEVPARIRFLSMEPLLGPVDLSEWLREDGVHWIISGGESGPHARPSHPAWFRSLRDQCASAGASYLHKQNGAWAPGTETKGRTWVAYADGGLCNGPADSARPHEVLVRGPKHRRDLDGLTWDGVPGA